jgi:hypothetical protein
MTDEGSGICDSGWMQSRTRSAVVVLGSFVVVAVLIALFLLVRRDRPEAGPSGPGAGGPPPATSEPAGSAPTASAPTALSPFTGRPAPIGRPVLAVKIDNVRPARPQTGLGRADVVYVEPVEGGLSRILAIFSAQLPPLIGPVRSARESDLELLGQYARPGLVYSGANRTVSSAIRTASVVDLSPGPMPSAYRRSSSKAAPHNLLVDPRELVARANGVSAARDIGFRFGALPAGTGTPTSTKTVRHGSASTGFRWSPARNSWDVSLDGRPATTTDGGRLRASTVVVQYTEITSSAQRDVLGNRTPYTHTVGSGTALVLRDGAAIEARWSRPSAGNGTTFTTATGAALPFAVGQVWVVYAPSPNGG